VHDFDLNRNLPSPKDIINLGEELNFLRTPPEKQVYFKKFIKTHFNLESIVWLISSKKLVNPDANHSDLPFNPQDVLRDNPIDACDYKIIEQNCWYFFTLEFQENKFGLVAIKSEDRINQTTLAALTQIINIARIAFFISHQTILEDWREKQLSLVHTVSEKFSQITNRDTLVNQVVQLVQETFHYYYVAIFLINQEDNKLYFEASTCTTDGDRPEFESVTHPGFDLGEHIIGYVAQSGQALVANNVFSEPRYKQVGSLPETKSEAVLPIKVQNRVFGVFDVQSNRLNAFNEDDLLVLQALVNSISLAVESVFLYKGFQTQANQLETVANVSRSITLTLDIDVLLQNIVTIIHERFNFPYVHLYITDPVQEKITFKAGSGDRTQYYENASAFFDLNSEKGIIPWVVRNQKTYRSNNVTKEPLFLESQFSEQIIGSEMAVPLSFGGEPLGVLDIQSDHINAFTKYDQHLIETLADNLAIAIRNAQLYRSEKWRRRVAESMRDVAGLLSENIDFKNVLDTILIKLQANLPCDIAVIWLFNPKDDSKPLQTQPLHLAAYRTSEDYPKELLDGLSFYPDAWVLNALSNELPLIRKPEDTVGPIAKIYQLASNYSSIATPLRTGDEVLGILNLIHHLPRKFGDESQKITSAFANYAAIAIKNTRLYTNAQEQAWIATILLEVSQAIQSLTNLDELVKTIVRLTPMVAGVKGCGLFLSEPSSNDFSLYALYGIGDNKGELDLEKPIRVSQSPILDELILTKEPLYIRNPEIDLNLPDYLTDELGKDNLILVPLLSRDEILGAFLLANETDSDVYETEVFSAERMKIIQGIIQQTTVAVENIRLIEAKQEEAYVSTVLLQTAQAVVNNTDLNDTLDSIVHIMPILVGIDANIIYIWDEEQQVFRASNASIKEKTEQNNIIGETYAPGDFPMLDAVFKNNRPIVYPFVDTRLQPGYWDLALPDEEQTEPIKVLKSPYPVLMGFPISMQNEVFGVLLAEDRNVSINRERRFELISGIAQQTSMAIQNDIINRQLLERQRLDREFQLAREIQQTFLPEELPSTPGWKFDVLWQTARQVGGDFYDYFLLPDGRLAFVIADVSDKGLAASLYMAVTRTLIRAVAFDSYSPAKTLERVNELLLSNSQNGLFVTVFYGILALDTGELIYTIAGHNPPMVIKNYTKEVLELEKGGIALGALMDISLSQNQLSLDHGDCLTLYTDGVSEAFNDQDEIYGTERLRKILETSFGKNAKTVVERIESDLILFRDNEPLSDDTTILAISRNHLLANQHREMSAS
jgi:GAF domain-containing protein